MSVLLFVNFCLCLFSGSVTYNNELLINGMFQEKQIMHVLHKYTSKSYIFTAVDNCKLASV